MGSIVSSIFGGGGGGGASVPAAPPQSQYDPYGAIGGRQQAATQLQSLMNDPSAALGMPGYQLGMGQGTAALQAQGAKSGMLQSGGQNAALQSFGQNYFGTAYNQLYSQLGTLSGATTQTPSSATQAQYSGQLQQSQLQNQIQQQNAQTGIFSTLLAGSALSKSGIFGGGSGGPFGFMSDPLMSGGDLSTTLSGASGADSMAWIDYAAEL